MKWLIISICVVICVPVGALTLTPWYENKYAYWFQENVIHWTPWSRPEKYTGTLYHYDRSIRLKYSEDLVDGDKNGFIREYDDAGAVTSEEEWKAGRPWAGLCHFWEGKAWVARYKDGKVMDGAMNEYDPGTKTYAMVYYVDGNIVDKEAFCIHHKMPTTSKPFGLHFFK